MHFLISKTILIIIIKRNTENILLKITESIINSISIDTFIILTLFKLLFEKREYLDKIYFDINSITYQTLNS